VTQISLKWTQKIKYFKSLVKNMVVQTLPPKKFRLWSNKLLWKLQTHPTQLLLYSTQNCKITITFLQNAYEMRTIRDDKMPTRTWWIGICGGQRTMLRGIQQFQASRRNQSICRPCIQRKMRFAWNQTYRSGHSSNTDNRHR